MAYTYFTVLIVIYSILNISEINGNTIRDSNLGKRCNEINQVEECGRFACYVNQIANDTTTTSSL